MGFITGLDKLNLLIEAKCKDVAPWKIIGVTAITTYSLLRFRDFLSDEEFSKLSDIVVCHHHFLSLLLATDSLNWQIHLFQV